jgi:hypothetical protein
MARRPRQPAEGPRRGSSVVSRVLIDGSTGDPAQSPIFGDTGGFPDPPADPAPTAPPATKQPADDAATVRRPAPRRRAAERLSNYVGCLEPAWRARKSATVVVASVEFLAFHRNFSFPERGFLWGRRAGDTQPGHGTPLVIPVVPSAGGSVTLSRQRCGRVCLVLTRLPAAPAPPIIRAGMSGGSSRTVTRPKNADHWRRRFLLSVARPVKQGSVGDRNVRGAVADNDEQWLLNWFFCR